MTSTIKDTFKVIKCKIGITFLKIEKWFYENDVINKTKKFIQENKRIILVLVGSITLLMTLMTLLFKNKRSCL